MRKLWVSIASVLPALALVLAYGGQVHATPTDPNADHKVTLCHRTGSIDGGNQDNGYDFVTVDIASSGLVNGGHTGHEQVGNGPGPDIIPAYDAFAKVQGVWVPFSYPGFHLDWVFASGDTGATFLANGCRFTPPPSTHLTATGPTFVDPTCDNEGVTRVDLPTDAHITYQVTGTAGPGNSVTVTATADEGFVLDGTTMWDHRFPTFDPESCSTPPSPVDVCPNIEGIQQSVPDGYVLNDEGQCVPVTTPTQTPPPQPTQPEAFIFSSCTDTFVRFVGGQGLANILIDGVLTQYQITTSPQDIDLGALPNGTVVEASFNGAEVKTLVVDNEGCAATAPPGTWTPTWIPTWTPVGPPGVEAASGSRSADLAFTGASRSTGPLAVAAGLLALLGLGALWGARAWSGKTLR